MHLKFLIKKPHCSCHKGCSSTRWEVTQTHAIESREVVILAPPAVDGHLPTMARGMHTLSPFQPFSFFVSVPSHFKICRSDSTSIWREKAHSSTLTLRWGENSLVTLGVRKTYRTSEFSVSNCILEFCVLELPDSFAEASSVCSACSQAFWNASL